MGVVILNELVTELKLNWTASPNGMEMELAGVDNSVPLVTVFLSTSDLISLLSRVENAVQSQARHFKELLDNKQALDAAIQGVLE